MLTTEKEMVRLGRGGGEMKQLAPDAIERGIRALERMAQVATSFDEVDLVAVATSAVREATNRHEFIERARREASVSEWAGLVELYDRLDKERRELIARIRDRWLGGDLDALVSKARDLAQDLRTA